MFGNDFSIILRHAGPPSVISTSWHRCCRSFSVTADFSPSGCWATEEPLQLSSVAIGGSNEGPPNPSDGGEQATTETAAFSPPATMPVAHLGRHAHPSKSPMRAAIQSGAARIASSATTPSIVDFLNTSVSASTTNAMSRTRLIEPRYGKCGGFFFMNLPLKTRAIVNPLFSLYFEAIKSRTRSKKAPWDMVSLAAMLLVSVRWCSMLLGMSLALGYSEASRLCAFQYQLKRAGPADRHSLPLSD
ncbi:hypothetical protein B296_00036498 [Ensete ventricosum]|uniref:Uncharacterized protein n=1 Tax=Ensete ventricosum TaxID=4639 RepID=A0A426Z597_ENSVE|nr:hypothetical protein B296_00036498 [Ensete ventricosum]